MEGGGRYFHAMMASSYRELSCSILLTNSLVASVRHIYVVPLLSCQPVLVKRRDKIHEKESKGGSFQEIGAKWSKFSKFRAKIALLEALSC